MEEMKIKLRKHEYTLEMVENELGIFFTGDYIGSIRALKKKCRTTSINLNPFQRSKTKREDFIEKDDTISSTQSTIPVYYTLQLKKLKKELEQAAQVNSLSSLQIEGLRETLRHTEFDIGSSSNNLIYQNLRGLLVEVLSKLPIL